MNGRDRRAQDDPRAAGRSGAAASCAGSSTFEITEDISVSGVSPRALGAGMDSPRTLLLYAVSAAATAIVFAVLAAAADAGWWILAVAMVVHFAGFMAYIHLFARRLGKDDGEDAPGRPGRDGAPGTADSQRAEGLSKRMPEAVSGEGATPLGSTDQLSDAPGPHGLGNRVARPAEE